jgi:hypothetical protein
VENNLSVVLLEIDSVVVVVGELSFLHMQDVEGLADMGAINPSFLDHEVGPVVVIAFAQFWENKNKVLFDVSVELNMLVGHIWKVFIILSYL